MTAAATGSPTHVQGVTLSNADTRPALRSLPATASAEEVLAVLEEDGGLVIKDYLTPEEVTDLNGDIEPAMRALAPGHRDPVREELLGKNTKRLTNMVELSRTLGERVLDKDLMHGVGDAIFGRESGTYWLGTAHVIEIGPRNVAQPLHRDLEGWPIFYRMGKDAPDIILNFIVALSDFTEENGATRIIPGSHKWDFCDPGTPEQTIPVLMDAGDVVIFSGKVIHGGGHNRTIDTYRRGLTIPLLVGYLTPEEAIPMTTSIETARRLSPRVQRLVGYRSHHNVAAAVDLWQTQFKELGEVLGL